MTTLPELPGYRIARVHGTVYGLVNRSLMLVRSSRELNFERATKRSCK